jgi:secreted trypsin-like serine protease
VWSRHGRLARAAPALALAALVALVPGPTRAQAVSHPRIVGGGKANAAGWRFAVALEEKSRFICTGSMVAPDRVLTAAHCVKGDKRKHLSVLAGSASIGPDRPARIKVRHAMVDPKYNGRKVSHDFAVLTLATTSGAAPIALPTKAESAAATRPGMTVRSAGWGSRSAWGFRLAQRLKTAKERVYATRVCDREYGKAHGFVGASMICALGKRVRRFHSRLPFHSTTCSGDSGGPVVANTPTGPRLVGLVSAGAFPCGLGGASIYARVSSRLGFIRSAIGAG